MAGEASTVDRGHGRTDVRAIKTLPPTGRIAALFPHVKQVFLVERYSCGADGEPLGAVALLGVTSLPPDQADPGHLLAYLRGHWAIEVQHYVRDVVFGEDASRVGRAHRAMAAVRNTVIGGRTCSRSPACRRRRPRSLTRSTPTSPRRRTAIPTATPGPGCCSTGSPGTT